MIKYAIGESGTLDLASTTTSDIYPISSKKASASVQLSWTGVAIGNIVLQRSNNRENWSSLDMIDTDGNVFSVIPVSGAEDQELVLIVNCTVPFLRIKYNSISGTGTLNFTVRSKSRG